MLLLFILVLKIAQAQILDGFISSQQYLGPQSQNLKISQSPLDQLSLWSNQPKCWPSEAKAYFLPAAPEVLKTAVYNPKPSPVPVKKDTRIIEQPFAEKYISKKTPKIELPPPCCSMIPGIFDDFPETFLSAYDLCPSCKRHAIVEEVQEKPILLPNMFNFDQELLSGFLSSLGLWDKIVTD